MGHAHQGGQIAPVIDLFTAKAEKMNARQAERLVGVVFVTCTELTRPILSFEAVIRGEGLLPRPWLDSLEVIIEDGTRICARLGPAHSLFPPDGGYRHVILSTDPINGFRTPSKDAVFAIDCEGKRLWEGRWGRLHQSQRDFHERQQLP